MRRCCQEQYLMMLGENIVCNLCMAKTPDNSRQILGVIGSLAAAGAISLGLAASGGKEKIDAGSDATHNAVAEALDLGHLEAGDNRTVANSTGVQIAISALTANGDEATEHIIAEKALEGDFESVQTILALLDDEYTQGVGSAGSFGGQSSRNAKMLELGIDNETYWLMRNASKVRVAHDNLNAENFDNDAADNYERTGGYDGDPAGAYTTDLYKEVIYGLLEGKPSDPLAIKIISGDENGEEMVRDLAIKVIKYAENNSKFDDQDIAKLKKAYHL